MSWNVTPMKSPRRQMRRQGPRIEGKTSCHTVCLSIYRRDQFFPSHRRTFSCNSFSSRYWRSRLMGHSPFVVLALPFVPKFNDRRDSYIAVVLRLRQARTTTVCGRPQFGRTRGWLSRRRCPVAVEPIACRALNGTAGLNCGDGGSGETTISAINRAGEMGPLALCHH